MKTAAIPPTNVEPAAIESETRRRVGSDFAELVKARLTLLVLLTTAVGFYLGRGRRRSITSRFSTPSSGLRSPRLALPR